MPWCHYIVHSPIRQQRAGTDLVPHRWNPLDKHMIHRALNLFLIDGYESKKQKNEPCMTML